MRHSPVRDPLVLLVAIVSLVVSARAAGQMRRPAVLDLVPPDAEAVVCAPSVKAVSDQITLCLQGMGRDHLLLAARPLDAFKAMLSVSTGLNEFDGAAVALLPKAAEDDSPGLLILAPVTDAALFLDRNFEPAGDGRVRHGSGRVFHAVPLGSHVALSTRPVEGLGAEPAVGFTDLVHDALGSLAEQMVSGTEVFLVSRSRRATMLLLDELPAVVRASLGPAPEQLAGSVWDSIDVAMAGIDFDPLAVVVRTAYRLREPLGDDGRAGPLDPMTAVPAGGYGGAIVRLEHPLVRGWANAAARAATGGPMPALRAHTALVHLGELQSMAPTPVLAGAAAHLLTLDPAADRAAIEARLDELAPGKVSGPLRVRRVGERDGGVGRFEIAASRPGPAGVMAATLLEGLAGSPLTLTVASTDERVVLAPIAPSPTDAVMRSVDAGGSLATDPVVSAMRAWLPSVPIVEGSLRADRFVPAALASLGRAGIPGAAEAARAIRFQGGEPPVAGAVAADARRIEAALIVPVQVIAPLIDWMVDRAARRAKGE